MVFNNRAFTFFAEIMIEVLVNCYSCCNFQCMCVEVDQMIFKFLQGGTRMYKTFALYKTAMIISKVSGGKSKNR